MAERRLTTEEAIAFALDPRNDNGQANQLHVMAFSYDQDCPNYEDHVGAIIEADEGFWQEGVGWGIEADATLFTDEEADTRPTLPEGTDVHWLNQPCRCWDGITDEDVDTFTNDGIVDEAGFGEWGPFMLVSDADVNLLQPRGMTPDEALSAIQSRLEAYESSVGNNGLSRRMDDAITVLHKFITVLADLEWGDPGECWERIANDEDLRLELAQAQQEQPDLAKSVGSLSELAQKLGLGRHYGDPHCIWCLQAQ